MEYESKGVSGNMDKESLCAEFPDNWEEFVNIWKYNIEEWDQEGLLQTKEVIDIYRVKQMMWYYLRDYIKLGNACSSEDYTINIVPDETRDFAHAVPYFVVVRKRFL